MKNIFIVIILFAGFAQAQVGVNTSTPAKMLDVNGTLNVRKEIRTGGTSTVVGSAGNAGQLFGFNSISSDTWKTVQIADGTGSLSLFYLNTVKDVTGLQFTQTGSTGIYSLDSGFTSSTNVGDLNWQYITNAHDSFVVTKTDNLSKAVLSFQTTVQIARPAGLTWTTSSASFACGIFVEKDGVAGKLKAVRNDVVRGIPGTYKVYNLNVTLDALAAGSYVVRAACANRQLNSGATLVTLGVGKPVDTSNLNVDMAQTTLTTSLLQTY
ncbi:hypothetical protein [Chryseobacterium sp. GP-SGM7]|uniref:hypothetical protein n=1 Tax=Chryseobacterium sp. GP-SGM7 TaxID=3411323 RepID=UPI003B95CD2F